MATPPAPPPYPPPDGAPLGSRSPLGPRRLSPSFHILEIAVYNRQRKARVPLPWLRRLACIAVEEALPHALSPDSPLCTLEEVEVTFVSDATIAKVHLDFMAIPGATDVITFDHGEIVISTETAAENAQLYDRKLDEELALYIVHGLLHLGGYEDAEPEDARRMHELQEQILKRCLSRLTRG